MRTLTRARWALALVLLCAGAFSVPFGVTWWLEGDRVERMPPVAAPAHLPSSYTILGGIDGLVNTDATEPAAEELVSVELNAVEVVDPRAEPVQEPGPPVLIDEIRSVLQSSFYLPVPQTALEKPSVGQILDALGDPYTNYLSPHDFARVIEDSRATYEGVGLLVGQSDVGLIVTSALTGPARDAGIRPGDTIISIDGNTTRSLPFDRAISLFRGKPGSIVTLTIQRPGEDEPQEARVARQLIPVPAVRERILNTDEQDLGYIRLLSFPVDAGQQVREATQRLLDQGAEGFVLDLRGNPGGYLQEAIEVASVFLNVGVICSTDGLHRQPETYSTSGGALAGDLPLVTLVDGQSASAAEIVAAALRENNRGRLVGVSTFGKASIQSVVPLENGGGLQLTTAMYVTPRGNRIAGEGVRSHVEALDDPLTRPDEALRKARSTLAELVEHRHEPPRIHF